MASARLNHAVRRLADQQAARHNDPPSDRPIITTVTAVTAGGASDGNALVAVTWRGQQITVNGYVNSYTPAVNDRVVCTYVGRQLIVLGRVIGHP